MNEEKLLIYFETLKECDRRIELFEKRSLKRSKLENIKKEFIVDLKRFELYREELIDTIMTFKITFVIKNPELNGWYFYEKAVYESKKILQKKII